MYINSIQVKKFRHLENAIIGPINLNSKKSDLISLAGPNGSGKSSVLELIGYALSSSYSLGWQLSRTFNGFSFEIGIGLTKEETSIIVTALKKEIEPTEFTIKEQCASIDRNELLSPEIKVAQKIQISENYKRQIKHHYDMLEYLETSNTYFRSFDYTEGEYSKNPTLHNQIHSFVTRELKESLKRSLGFFLRSDRNYPQKTFEQRKIFGYDNIIKKEHLWTMAFNTSEIQYMDMYDYLVQQKYHYLRELGHFYDQKNKGLAVGSEPSDPIKPYEELLNGIFPQYKFADKDENVPTNLFVMIPSGEILPFNDLSSGEKEVFFILSFFVRHNVENAIIVIDEPELHLHPELSRILIRNIRTIRNGNQIWLATHNAEIIDETGRDKVIYINRDIETRKAKFINGYDEDGTLQSLRNLFGYSGYIGIAKNLVFLEGSNSSQDRKYFSTLFPDSASSIKIIPSNSSDNTHRLNAALLSILESNMGFIKFHLIRDRDYLTPEMVEKYCRKASGKIYVLTKHELENYLISFEIIKNILKEIYEIDIDLERLKNNFKDAANIISSDVLRDMISFRLNLLFGPQDFSIEKVLKNTSYFDISSDTYVPNETSQGLIKTKYTEKAEAIRTILDTHLANSKIEEMIATCESEVKSALESNNWLSLFPGKELLDKTLRNMGITNTIAFQNQIIKEMASNREYIDVEIERILEKILT